MHEKNIFLFVSHTVEVRFVWYERQPLWCWYYVNVNSLPSVSTSVQGWSFFCWKQHERWSIAHCLFCSPSSPPTKKKKKKSWRKPSIFLLRMGNWASKSDVQKSVQKFRGFSFSSAGRELEKSESLCWEKSCSKINYEMRGVDIVVMGKELAL